MSVCQVDSMNSMDLSGEETWSKAEQLVLVTFLCALLEDKKGSLENQEKEWHGR